MVIGSKLPILVHSDCYNKIPLTGMAYKQQKFIAHSSGGWEIQDVGLADVVYDEDPLPVSSGAIFSLCPHMAQRQRSFLESLSLMMLMSFMRALFS